MLFGAESADGVYGGGAHGGEDAGEQGAESECDDRCEEDDRVPLLDVIELRGDEARASDGCGDADGEADEDLGEGPAEDEADDFGSVGAEGHADADFAGAAGDDVGGDSVEADGGEDEREDAEESGHLGDDALLIEAVGDLLVHGVDVEDGEVRVDLGDGAADLWLEAREAAADLEDDVFDEMGAVVDFLHKRGVVVDMLSEGHEEERRAPVS